MRFSKIAVFAAIILPLLAACSGGGGSSNVFVDELADADIIPVIFTNQGGKLGYVDGKGNRVIEPKFNAADYFHEGLALVGVETEADSLTESELRLGYINKKGEYVIEPKYASASDFSCGLAWVAEPDSPLVAIDTKGVVKLRLPEARFAAAFDDDYAVYWNLEGTMAIVAKDGQRIDLPGYKKFIAINEGYAFGDDREGNRLFGRLDKNGYTPVEIPGNFVIEQVAPNKELAIVRKGNQCGVVNFKGEYVINPRYENMTFDGADLIAFKDEKEKLGWMDLGGNVVIPAKYKAIAGFFESGVDGCNKYAIVSTSGSKFQVIDREGKTVVQPKYDNIERGLNPELFKVKRNDKWGLVNAQGEEVCEPQFKDVEICSKHVILATSGSGEWGVIDEYGKYEGATDLEFFQYTMHGRSQSMYFDAEGIADLVDACREKMVIGKSIVDLAKEFDVTTSNVTEYYDSYVTLKGIKGEGYTVVFGVLCDKSAITGRKSKRSFDPSAKAWLYEVNIYGDDDKRAKVRAALEKRGYKFEENMCDGDDSHLQVIMDSDGTVTNRDFESL